MTHYWAPLISKSGATLPELTEAFDAPASMLPDGYKDAIFRTIRIYLFFVQFHKRWIIRFAFVLHILSVLHSRVGNGRDSEWWKFEQIKILCAILSILTVYPLETIRWICYLNIQTVSVFLQHFQKDADGAKLNNMNVVSYNL